MSFLLSRPAPGLFTFAVASDLGLSHLQMPQRFSVLPALRRLVLRRALRSLADMNELPLSEMGFPVGSLDEPQLLHAGADTDDYARQRTAAPSCVDRP